MKTPAPRTSMVLHFLAGLCLAGCASISSYDQIAYEKTTGAKAEALALMDKANDSYPDHAKEAQAVSLAISKAYEYDAGRPLNKETIAMWRLLLFDDPEEPDDNLWPNFLADWKRKGAIHSEALPGRERRIAHAFDQIIGLESGKLRRGSRSQ